MAQTVVLKVGMSCQGCVGAVKRVLTKMEGVESFDVDIKEQKVTVKGTVEPQVVLEKVSKTGKKTEFWKDEPVVEVVSSNAPAAATAEAAPAASGATETARVDTTTIETALAAAASTEAALVDATITEASPAAAPTTASA